MNLLLLAGVAATGFVYWDDSVWAPKWIVLLFWAVFWIALSLKSKFHWSASLPIISVLFSGLWISESHMHQYLYLSSVDQVALRELAARGSLAFLLIIFSVFLMHRRHYIIIESFFGFFCVINALVVIFEALQPGIRPFHIGGILGNSSMNGCAIALLYPFAAWRGDYEKRFPMVGGFLPFVKELVYVWAPPVAVFCTQSTMAIATLCITFFAFFWSQYQVRIKTLVIAGATIGLISWKLLGEDFINSSGRFAIWKAIMGHFLDKGNIWIGSGTGSTQALVPFLQMQLKVNTGNQIFLWLHSDVLQVFFEQGVFGVIAFGIATFYALKRTTLRQPYLFAALSGWLMTAAANYPARMAFHAFIGVFIYAVALRKEEDELTTFNYTL